MNLFDISNKVALVTGATQGIGYTLAKGLAEAGAKVYLNGRNQEKLTEAVQTLNAQSMQCFELLFDVDQTLQVEAAVSHLIAQEGRIDILINNAGIIRREKLEVLTETDWDAVLATNLKAPFVISKYVVRQMIKQNQGKIINICSLMSELGRDTVGAYSAAKGGLKMLTKNMATEWGRHNIQVNGIGPGYIATPINAQYREPGNSLNQYIISRTPAQRWGNPEDLLGAAIFLASPASNFVNGHILYVDGGVLATFGNPDEF